MSIRRTSNKGFTLVEILIVVIILGILAAIVIPQFTNASQDARRSSLSSQLQTLRSQIELYKLQHNDALPNLSDATLGWTQLTAKTDVDGAVGTTAGTHVFGPYLQAPPKNPLTNSTLVVNGTAATVPAVTDGFVYDYAAGVGTGKIWGVEKVNATTAKLFVE